MIYLLSKTLLQTDWLVNKQLYNYQQKTNLKNSYCRCDKRSHTNLGDFLKEAVCQLPGKGQVTT